MRHQACFTQSNLHVTLFEQQEAQAPAHRRPLLMSRFLVHGQRETMTAGLDDRALGFDEEPSTRRALWSGAPPLLGSRAEQTSFSL